MDINDKDFVEVKEIIKRIDEERDVLQRRDEEKKHPYPAALWYVYMYRALSTRAQHILENGYKQDTE